MGKVAMRQLLLVAKQQGIELCTLCILCVLCVTGFVFYVAQRTRRFSQRTQRSGGEVNDVSVNNQFCKVSAVVLSSL